MWSERNQAPTPPVRLKVIALVSLLAPFLGGSTEPWAQGVTCAAIGFTVLLFPPQHRLSSAFYALALAFLILPLSAFLPASWFGLSPWRAILTRDLQLALPWTVSPQPWLSVECWLLMAAGLLWLAYVSACSFNSEARCKLARDYVTGAALLAALAIVLDSLRMPLPFWHPRENFGFFPNRNQMSDWLALAGILTVAILQQDWQKKRLFCVWWTLVLVLLGSALVLTGSRSGILLFFMGTAGFLVWMALGKRVTAQVVISLTAMILLLTLFLIFGGSTLSRIQTTLGAQSVDQTIPRWKIQQDAFAMKRQSPLFGVGLGNFSAVFPFYRDQSRSEARNVHPESDWMWLATESGWLTVAVAAAGLVLLLTNVLPMERGTDRPVRMAATLAVVAFAAHGLFDVSGHRLGSFVPACLFVALMFHPRYLQPASTPFQLGLRAVGLLIILVGGYWIASAFPRFQLPGSQDVARAKKQADAAIASRDPQIATAAIDRALRWTPLDWELYFRRAKAELLFNPGLARLDFLRARQLEPTSSILPMEEGYLWLRISSANTLSAWREALARNTHNPAEYFYEMLVESANFPDVHAGLRELSLMDPSFFLVNAEQATPEEFHQLRLRVLQDDPYLDHYNFAQKQTLFRFWAEKEGLRSVIDAIQQEPSWKQAAWQQVSNDLAAHDDFQNAYLLAHSSLPIPTFPALTTRDSLITLEHRVNQRPDDFASAYLLIRTLNMANSNKEALAQARFTIQQHNCPAYFHYLMAEAAAALGDWPTAWHALDAYQHAKK